ncbi:MAG: secondary thiamine-phosphate synthase enzyme YjbQ [Actinomycetota bacterium]|nr:secondary thiamine-phosphate synthase enzyme YjbQ [Actinomycetota bacterium]
MVFSSSIALQTKGNTHIIDITPKVSEVLKKSGLKMGVVVLFVPGSTAGLTTVEYEPGLEEDLKEMFERIAPQGRGYHHNLRWNDGNGHSHVRASLLGPSLVIPFEASRLLLGTWQQIVLIDFDNKPRSRRVLCQVLGE